MGVFKKVVKVARVVTSTDIGTGTTSCRGCGKTIKAHKSNVCSTKCAEFYAKGKWGRGDY